MADLTAINSNTYRDKRNQYRYDAQQEAIRDQQIEAAQQEALARTAYDQAAMAALRELQTPPAPLPSQTPTPAAPAQAPASPLQGVVAGQPASPAPLTHSPQHVAPHQAVQQHEQRFGPMGLNPAARPIGGRMGFMPQQEIQLPAIQIGGSDPAAQTWQQTAPNPGPWQNPNAPQPMPPGSPAMGYTPPQAQGAPMPQSAPAAAPAAPGGMPQDPFAGHAFEQAMLRHLSANPGPGTGRAVSDLITAGRTRVDHEQQRTDEMEKLAMTALASGDMPTFQYWQQKSGLRLPAQAMKDAQTAGLWSKGMLVAEKFYRENPAQGMKFAQAYMQSGGDATAAYAAAGVPYGKPQYDLKTILMGEQQVLAQIDQATGHVRVLQGPDGKPLRTAAGADGTGARKSSQQMTYEWLLSLGVSPERALQAALAQKPENVDGWLEDGSVDADGDGEPDEIELDLNGQPVQPNPLSAADLGVP